jgi:hypothetical protein
VGLSSERKVYCYRRLQNADSFAYVVVIGSLDTTFIFMSYGVTANTVLRGLVCICSLADNLMDVLCKQ